MFWVAGQVMQFKRVGLSIVQLFPWTRFRHNQTLISVQLTRCVETSHGLLNWLVVLVPIRLKIRPIREPVENVFPTSIPDTAHQVDGFIGSITRGEDILARLIIGGKNILRVHRRRPCNSSQPH